MEIFGGEAIFRTCLHKKYMWIFEHNFVADKAKIRRRAVARQVFFTQDAAKFAEKTRGYACEDRFLFLRKFRSAVDAEPELAGNFFAAFRADMRRLRILCATLDAEPVAGNSGCTALRADF